MAAFEIIETINSPGTPGKGGDDRFGFDAGAGTAWVLDGATDVTDLQPFPKAESGAAWLAEALSNAFLANPPDIGETAKAYFQRVLSCVRELAEDTTAIPLETLPGEAWPIASGIWAQLRDGQIAFSWTGDCMALDLSTGAVIGPVEAAASESQGMRRIADLSHQDIRALIRKARRASYMARKSIFSLRPDVIAPAPPIIFPAGTGAEFVLMSDGFYRLVEPYGLYDGETLASAIKAKGLAALIAEIRAFEGASENRQIPRAKSADDACALWLSCR